MPKSPLKDYTAILEQSRTKKKEDPIYREKDRYEYVARKLIPSIDLEDTQVKLELALKHNTRLLDQNATLSEMANSLRFELKNCQDDILILKRQNEDFVKNTAKEREVILMQTQIKSSNHELELKRLLEEISTLHEQKNNLEIVKTQQIEGVKADFQKSLLVQMQNLKNIQSNAKELYELQIQSFKEQLKKQQYQIDNLKSLQRLEKNRLKDQLTSAENQIKHIKLKYQIDLKELQRQNQKQRSSERRLLEQQKELQTSSKDVKIKRLKKQLLDKAKDLEIVNKKMFHQEQSSQLETLNFRKDKENLLAELTNNEIIFKTAIMKEKTKLEELSKLQISNLTQLYQTNIEQLQGEVNRLRLLIDCKTEEIKDSYEQNRKLKNSFTQEVEWHKKENQHLKSQLKTIQLQHKEQDEMMKIKLATLIQTNIQQVSAYFQKQLANLSIHNREINSLNKDLKDRIYKLIHDNDEIRKNFEAELSKHKARIQDYKIKLASISLEHKEYVGSLTSKVQMTSQTLIREGETKDRKKAFYEDQKRKFHALANQKDQEISDLIASLQSIKQMHEKQLQTVRQERQNFKQEIQKIEIDQRILKQKLESELALKDQKLKNLKFDNQKELEEIKELERKIDESEKQCIKLKKTNDHLNLVNQSLAQELGLKKGFIETLQLESNAAIQQEKNKIRVLMGSHQVTLKEYFEDKLKSKNQDIESLEKKLVEKQQDIRQLILKYNALEKRFEMVMETQDKLRQFQEKIQQLGLDNNLVKNMAELFKIKGI